MKVCVIKGKFLCCKTLSDTVFMIQKPDNFEKKNLNLSLANKYRIHSSNITALCIIAQKCSKLNEIQFYIEVSVALDEFNEMFPK